MSGDRQEKSSTDREAAGDRGPGPMGLDGTRFAFHRVVSSRRTLIDPVSSPPPADPPPRPAPRRSEELDATRRSSSFTYSVTAAAMAATVYFRWQFQHLLGERGLYSTFLPCVIIASHFGGFWPGLFTTLASVALTNSLLERHLIHLDANAAGDSVALAIFVGTGIVISALSESLLRSQDRRLQAEQERRAQQTLRQTEERFTHLMLHSSDIIGVFSPDGTVLYTTPSVMRILGYPASERIGKNLLRDPIVHPDDQPIQQAFLASILASPGMPIRSEFRLRHANGSWRDFEAIGQILMDDPTVVVLIANYRDITDRKASEYALQDSEQRWRGLIQTLPQLIWTSAPDGGPTYFSPQFATFCGRSAESLLNDGWQQTIHPDDLGRVLELWRAAVAAREPFQNEHRIRRADGVYRWFQVVAVPVGDHSGAVVRWLGSCTDVTDLKQSARALLDAKDAAESANRAKDAFLANVSHEIRTPLNAVLGMTDLVLDSPLDESQRTLLGTVKAAGGNLMEIVNDLLDFSKLEAGKLVLHPDRLSLRTLAREVTHLLALRAEEQGLLLQCEVAEEIPDAVVGDAGRLRQVLVNLLMNGIKFTPRGSVTLSVRKGAAGTAADEGRIPVEFLVRDTGIGISPEKQQLIIRAFEQEDTTTTRRFGGTGLGLTIASNLVRAMGGGDIQLESAPGQGSTFRFTIEFATALAAASEPAPASRLNGAAAFDPPGAHRPQRSLRILVAEDNVFNGQLMCRLLGKYGHTVVLADDGERALQAATSQSFDLLLLDLHMPRLDGLEVLRGLRKHEAVEGAGAGKRLPVIGLTARSVVDIREECLTAGMDDVLQKPAPPEVLFRTMERVLAPSDDASGTLPTLVDAEMLLAVCGADETVLEGLKAAFLENLPQQLDELRRFAAQGQLPQLREAAHKVAGMLRAFSRECGDLALAIEEAAIAGDEPSCRIGVERLLGDAGRLVREVEAMTFASLRQATPLAAS